MIESSSARSQWLTGGAVKEMGPNMMTCRKKTLQEGQVFCSVTLFWFSQNAICNKKNMTLNYKGDIDLVFSVLSSFFMQKQTKKSCSPFQFGRYVQYNCLTV